SAADLRHNDPDSGPDKHRSQALWHPVLTSAISGPALYSTTVTPSVCGKVSMCRNYHQESLAYATSLFVLILTTDSVTFYGRCRMIASKPTRGLTSRILHDEAHRRIDR